MTNFTVGELAAAILPPHEELAAVIDRVRNWTKEGLLRPAGKKHPGTGRHRLYGEDAIKDALVLAALTGLGVAAVRGSALLEIARHGFDVARRAQQGRLAGGTVYLIGRPDRIEFVRIGDGVYPADAVPFAEAIIVINMTALYARFENAIHVASMLHGAAGTQKKSL
jgi:DNA-binding transcriptional MerR regulator